MISIITITSYLILFYFLSINLSYIIFFIVSYFGISKYKTTLKLNDYMRVYQSKLTPPISLLVPAYNEELTIIKNIKAFLSEFDYPEYEVIVINDGSKDRTLKVVLEEFQCFLYDYPVRKVIDTKEIVNIYRSSIDKRLIVVDKKNGGKADALNTGINVSRYPYFGSIDADTILEPSSYLKVMIPVVNDSGNVIATGGIVGVINGCNVSENKIISVNYPQNILAKFQVVEYLRAFLFGRYAWTVINALPIISGAFGLFKKEAVAKVGGYSSSKTGKGTVGEDMDLIIRLHKYYLENKLEYKIVFVPDPLSWTQVPEDLVTLKNQRSRWHRGLMETLYENRKVLFNKKYGKIGLLSLPYYLIFEFMAPIVELYGYLSFPFFFFTGKISFEIFALFLILSVLLGVLISILAVFLEVITFNRYKDIADIFKLFLYAIAENFGYRQMTLVFRLVGIFQYFRKKTHWGDMKRKAL